MAGTCVESRVLVESTSIPAGPMDREPSHGGYEPIESGVVFW